jgi:hypothetical protein
MQMLGFKLGLKDEKYWSEPYNNEDMKGFHKDKGLLRRLQSWL